jgi:hypothetical protein
VPNGTMSWERCSRIGGPGTTWPTPSMSLRARSGSTRPIPMRGWASRRLLGNGKLQLHAAEGRA